MTVDYTVPFYPNTSDDTHCFQAALKMVLKYFKSEEEYSWKELDTLSNKKKGLWTWPMAGMLWMQENGFIVKDVESFDYKQFVEKRGKYLLEEFGEEVGRASIEHTDINQELQVTRKLLEAGLYEKRIPTQSEIQDLLQEEYLIISNINANKLNDKKGYVGHSVVIKGFSKTEFILHDPGLPPQENRKVSFETFEKAWAYPDEKAKNIMAFKLKK